MDPDSCLLRWTELCNGITVMPLSLGAAFALLLALMLLYTSGFVSASEIAFFSLSPSDLNDIEEENHPSDSKIKALLEDSERLLATILISNNFVNVTIIMLLNYVFASVIDKGNGGGNAAEKTKKLEESYQKARNAKPGSITAKANMVRDFDERNKKK